MGGNGMCWVLHAVTVVLSCSAWPPSLFCGFAGPRPKGGRRGHAHYHHHYENHAHAQTDQKILNITSHSRFSPYDQDIFGTFSLYDLEDIDLIFCRFQTIYQLFFRPFLDLFRPFLDHLCPFCHHFYRLIF